MLHKKNKLFLWAFIPILFLASAFFFFTYNKKEPVLQTEKKTAATVQHGLTNHPKIRKKSRKKFGSGKRKHKIEKITSIFVKVMIKKNIATGAFVSISANLKKNTVELRAETKSNGVAAFQFPASATKIKITASRSGYLSATYSLKRLSSPSNDFSIVLTLREKGVVITACVISESGLPSSNIFARIFSTDHQRIPALKKAFSTNIYDSEIVFDPIPVGLKNLCVSLKCDDMSECFSEVFDTIDEEDKTVIILAPPTSILYGKAIFSDGTPVGLFKLNANPVTDARGRFQLGKINKKIYTDKYGEYWCSGLIPAYYNIKIKSEQNADINTNIWITEGANFLDVTFEKLPFITLHGSTLLGNTDEAITNASVTFTSYLGDKSQKVLSDVFGNFNFDILTAPGRQPGEIKVEKDGFCDAVAYLSKGYMGQNVVIRLFTASSITGKVLTIDKKPVAGISVSASSFSADQKPEKKSDKKPPEENIDPGFNLQYGGISKSPSDEAGNYIIEDIAAPETYLVDAASPECFTMNQFDPSVNIVNVKPEKPTRHNLIVYTKNIIFVKAVNEEEVPVEKYDLQTKVITSDSQKTKNIKIDHKGEEWMLINIDNKFCHPKAEVSFAATTTTGESKESKTVKLCGSSTNYVTLKLELVEPQIAGHVYMPDKMPAVKATVFARAKASGSRAAVKTDHIGYFEIRGLKCNENEAVMLMASLRSQKAVAVTNIFAGDLDVEIILKKPQYVTGRVFYENYSFPASNFYVSLTANQKTGKEFFSEDGYFKFYINSKQTFNDKGYVYIIADGYSPEKIEVSFEHDDEFDAGDILLNDKFATVKGRVVNQDKKPVFADVYVRLVDSSVRMKKISTQSNQRDGTFTINNLPIEEMYLEAKTRVGKAVSKPFTPLSGEITTVPDLIIGTTNGILVELEFILPNGNPAARMYVEKFKTATDRNGILKLWLKPGNFRATKVFPSFVPKENSIGAKTDANLKYYISVPFVIDEETSRQIVRLESTYRITGIAFVNGKKYNGVLQFKLITQNTSFNAVAHDGIFKLNALPGKYIVICRPFSTATSAVLKNDLQNKIHFIAGHGKIELFFPWKGEWRASLKLLINGSYVNVAGNKKNKVSRMDFTELPAGKFSVSVTGFLKSGNTNFSRKAELYQDGIISVSF